MMGRVIERPCTIQVRPYEDAADVEDRLGRRVMCAAASANSAMAAAARAAGLVCSKYDSGPQLKF
eukprot:1154291-Pelagomonas_calceolata.AAC.3